MKGLPILLLASLLVITSSCNNTNEDDLGLEQDVNHVLFFSNDTDYSKEAPYYDALIELKKNYPTEIKNMLVLSPTNAKQYLNTFHIEGSPALLVIYNNDVMVKISGQVSKEEIIQPISEVLSKNSRKKILQ
jgi:hypothetical protein